MQIVMKPCRETHCHFCFNELPADVLFCLSCTISIYCSRHCLEQAIGKQFPQSKNLFSVHKDFSGDLANHFINLVRHENSEGTSTSFDQFHEHKHECGGAHWSSVLPSDIVLAGRVMLKFIDNRNVSEESGKSIEILDLAHNYHENPPSSKLELHLYALVLSHCLQRNYGSYFSSIGYLSSQLVLLISQIKVNSMAIIRMQSPGGARGYQYSPTFSNTQNAFTSTVEQVQVGKAIYKIGSLFNHSCQPNIHAYFLSRTLFLRATEFVLAGAPLELSYGPEVGKFSYNERQKLLKECYSFKCQCRGCLEPNLTDILVNAFRCIEPKCLGAVLDINLHRGLEEVFQGSNGSINCLLHSSKEDISNVAKVLLKKCRISSDLHPEHCLTCGSYRNLESLEGRLERDVVAISKLKDSSLEATGIALVGALRSLSHLRSLKHPYSKTIAQAEDIIAEAFVRAGEFNHALLHSRASIEIIEKLFGTNHIIVGHELLKLVSIQFSLGDNMSAASNTERTKKIFSRYYGPHALIIFPYLSDLWRKSQEQVDASTF